MPPIEHVAFGRVLRFEFGRINARVALAIVLIPAVLTTLGAVVDARSRSRPLTSLAIAAAHSRFEFFAYLVWQAMLLPVMIAALCLLVVTPDHREGTWLRLRQYPVAGSVWGVAKIVVVLSLLAVTALVHQAVSYLTEALVVGAPVPTLPVIANGVALLASMGGGAMIVALALRVASPIPVVLLTMTIPILSALNDLNFFLIPWALPSLAAFAVQHPDRAAETGATLWKLLLANACWGVAAVLLAGFFSSRMMVGEEARRR